MASRVRSRVQRLIDGFLGSDDLWMLEVPVKTVDEPRFIAIGMIDAKHWPAVRTPRGNRVRIISVRRARKEEISHYEGI